MKFYHFGVATPLDLIRVYWGDFRFKQKFRKAVVKFHGRALCMHCLNPLNWDDYQKREIAIKINVKIMLFCIPCDSFAKDQFISGMDIATAFRRWYEYCSGFPQETASYAHCLGNVLSYYGYEQKEESPEE